MSTQPTTTELTTYEEILAGNLCDSILWYDFKFECDEEFEWRVSEVKDIYQRFINSKYNNKDKGLYEPLKEFVKDMNANLRSDFNQEMYLISSKFENKGISYNEMRYKTAKEMLSK